MTKTILLNQKVLFCFFLQILKFQNRIVFVIFGFLSKKLFFLYWNTLLSWRKQFWVTLLIINTQNVFKPLAYSTTIFVFILFIACMVKIWKMISSLSICKINLVNSKKFAYKYTILFLFILSFQQTTKCIFKVYFWTSQCFFASVSVSPCQHKSNSFFFEPPKCAWRFCKKN